MPSPAPATGVLRLTRAGVLTLAAVSLSLVAHVLAGGAAPGLVGVLLATSPVLALSLLATGRRLGVVAVAALVALTQVGLHVAFMALASGAGRGMAPIVTGHHGERMLATSAPGVHPGVVMSLPDLALSGTSPLMTGSHVVAGALVALLLARGEAAAWSLWSWLRPAVPAAGRLPQPVEVPAPAATATLRSVDLGARPRPRGPPRHLAPTAPAARSLAAPA